MLHLVSGLSVIFLCRHLLVGLYMVGLLAFFILSLPVFKLLHLWPWVQRKLAVCYVFWYASLSFSFCLENFTDDRIFNTVKLEIRLTCYEQVMLLHFTISSCWGIIFQFDISWWCFFISWTILGYMQYLELSKASINWNHMEQQLKYLFPTFLLQERFISWRRCLALEEWNALVECC